METLTLTNGQTEQFTATFRNGDGTTMDLAGYTVTLEGRQNIPCTVSVGSGGVATFSFTALQTAAMRSVPRASFKLTNGSDVKFVGPFRIEMG